LKSSKGGEFSKYLAVRIFSIVVLNLLFTTDYRAVGRQKTYPRRHAARKFIAGLIDAVQDLVQGKGVPMNC